MILTAEEALKEAKHISKELSRTYGQLQQELIEPLVVTMFEIMDYETCKQLRMDMMVYGSSAYKLVDGKCVRMSPSERMASNGYGTPVFSKKPKPEPTENK